MNRILKISMVALALLIGTAGVSKAADNSAAPSKTLDNLMAAFNGESNANAKYLAFAKKADEEGYGKVASLFRAAAAAEKVHFENHAKVIVAMGGVPKADIKPAEVKSTKENLQAAINGESYERDTMYPEFIAEAKAAGHKDAVRTLNLALSVEAVHAGLYKDALNNLEQQKGGSKDFYVCLECGNTVTELPTKNCAICDSPKEKFLKVC